MNVKSTWTKIIREHRILKGIFSLKGGEDICKHFVGNVL